MEINSSYGNLPRNLPREIALLARVFPVLNRVEAVASAPRPEFEIPDHHALKPRALSWLVKSNVWPTTRVDLIAPAPNNEEA